MSISRPKWCSLKLPCTLASVPTEANCPLYLGALTPNNICGDCAESEIPRTRPVGQKGLVVVRYDEHALERSLDQALQRLFTGAKFPCQYQARSLAAAPDLLRQGAEGSVPFHSRCGVFEVPVSPAPRACAPAVFGDEHPRSIPEKSILLS